jgi:hypothetical protein
VHLLDFLCRKKQAERDVVLGLSSDSEIKRMKELLTNRGEGVGGELGGGGGGVG